MEFTISEPRHKVAVKKYIDKLPDNKVFSVKIITKRQKRTVGQNRLLWLWIGCISDETGYNRYDLHDFFKQRFLHGVKRIILDEPIVISPTTKMLDTKGFADYLERIRQFALTDLGIILPNPEDEHWAQFESRYEQFI